MRRVGAICDGPSNNGFRYNVQYNDHEISSTKFVTAFDLLYKDKKLFSYNQYSIHVYNETIRRLRADGDLPEKDPLVYKTAQECILLYDYDKILSKYARNEKDLEAFLSRDHSYTIDRNVENVVSDKDSWQYNV